MMKQLTIATALAGALLALSACGGGNDSGSTSATSTATTPSAGTSTSSTTTTTTTSTAASATSSGSITAFGSVFVNGHEFATDHAHVIDDDTGSTTTSSSNLEVGMSVDVAAASGSTDAQPSAGEIHLHPLARGYVDVSDSGASSLTVMGQTIQLTAATNFTDHRACVNATTSACTAIAGQSGLSATSEQGVTASVAGSYVTVYGYLFSSGTSSTTADIVATLVSVADAPATGTKAAAVFKAEGLVTATSGTTATIGGLSVDLSKATCRTMNATASCATAFSVGNIVSAYASAAPSLPATALVADGALLRPKLVVQTAGAAIELEGYVSGVSTTSFVMRGVTIDASALPSGTALPAVGDTVLVKGAVAADGNSVTASSVTVLRAAVSATYGFEGDATSVAAGTAANTYTLSVLGQTVTVGASTRLSDQSLSGRRGQAMATSTPFNITTFQTYLAASSSKHLVLVAQADSSGNLTAAAISIVPASTIAGISGLVDASPAPVNSVVNGTPSTFDVHGVAIGADPAAVLQSANAKAATVASGDFVVVLGSYANGTLTVAAPASGATLRSLTSLVIDLGVPTRRDHGGF